MSGIAPHEDEWTPVDERTPPGHGGRVVVAHSEGIAKEPEKSSPDMNDPSFWREFDDEAAKLSGEQSIVAKIDAEKEARIARDEAEERGPAPEPQPDPELSDEDFAKARAEALKDPSVGLWDEDDLAAVVEADPSLYTEPRTAEDLARNRRIAAQQLLLQETSELSSETSSELIIQEAVSDFDHDVRPGRDIANELREVDPASLNEFLEIWAGDDPGEVSRWRNEIAEGERFAEQARIANEHTRAERAQRQQLAELQDETASTYEDWVSDHPGVLAKYGETMHELMLRNPTELRGAEDVVEWLDGIYAFAREGHRAQGEANLLNAFDEELPLSTRQYMKEMGHRPATAIERFASNVKFDQERGRAPSVDELVAGFDEELEQGQPKRVGDWMNAVRESSRKEALKAAKRKVR